MKVKRTSSTAASSNVKQSVARTSSSTTTTTTTSTPGRSKPSSPKKESTRGGATSKIKFEPSHPILFSQNSNSCSNDTNLSAASSSTLVGGTVQNQQALILQKENKVRSLLKELQTLVKKCHQERLKNEPNVTTVTKTHERLRKEEKSKTRHGFLEYSKFYSDIFSVFVLKVTKFQRNKLRSIYSTVMKESDNEIK